MPSLLVVRHLDGSPRAGEEERHARERLTIGASGACDVVVDAAGVDGRHAEVQVVGDTAVLRDLGSAAGTWIGGARVEAPTPLDSGQVVRLGERGPGLFVALVETELETLAVADDEAWRLWAETLPEDVLEASDPARTYNLAATTGGDPDATLGVEASEDAQGGGSVGHGTTVVLAGQAEASVTLVRPEAEDYSVVGELGRGGMGLVERARQRSLEREVAIKKIRPDVASAAAQAMFVSEALVMGELEHPNIVPVHELALTPAGETVLAMKLVGGTEWRRLLHPRSEAEREAAAAHDLDQRLDVFAAVCNAVAFAHSRGIVHCDLKPENVMVGDFGEVLVMDWGVAVAFGGERDPAAAAPPASESAPSTPAGPAPAGRAKRRRRSRRSRRARGAASADADESATSSDPGNSGDSRTSGDSGPPTPARDTCRTQHARSVTRPRGTPCYMPPELAAGRGAEIGPATDVYLLGAILHELVTGHPPHRGRTLRSVLAAALESRPPELGDAHAELAGIVRRALERRPADRFPSAAALQEAVRAYREHRTSNTIAEAASCALAEAAQARPGLARAELASLRYGGFAEAVAGFRQAVVLWPENAAALAGAERARRAYAEAALAGGDLGLAAAQARRLDSSAGRELEARIHAAQAERERARRHALLTRRGLVAAALVIVTGLAVGFVAVSRARDEAELNAERADQQRLAAQRVTYRFYQEKHTAARDADARDEAALWLRAAIDVGRECELDVRADEGALLGELFGVSRPRWRVASDWPLLARAFQTTPTGPIWGADNRGGAAALLRGTTGDGGLTWSFERRFAGRVATDMSVLACWPGGGRLVAALDGAFATIDPETGLVDQVLPADGRESASPALFVPPGADHAYCIVGADLLRVRLTDGAVLAEHSLPYAASDGFWQLVVDEQHGQLALQATVAGSRKLVVCSLETGAELLSLERQSAATGALTSGAGRAVYAGSDGRLTCIEFGSQPRHWQRDTPWKQGQVVAVDEDAIEVLTSDGNLRRWSTAGELLSAEPVAGAVARQPYRMHRLPSGLWVSGFGELVVADAAGRDARACASSPREVAALATVGDSAYVIAFDGRAELRDLDASTLLSELALEGAERVVADRAGGALFAIAGGRLERYELASGNRSARSADARDADGAEPPPALLALAPVVLAGGAGLVAATDDGVFRFDARSLAQRERLCPQPESAGPAVLRALRGGELGIVYPNAELGRFEVLRYDLESARLHGPARVSFRVKDASAVALDRRAERLAWGTPSGQVHVAELPELRGAAPTRVAPGDPVLAGGERVAALCFVGDELLVARSDGALERLALRGGAWSVAERLHPLGDLPLAQVEPVGERGVLVRAVRGDHALVELCRLRVQHPNESAAIDGYNRVLHPALSAWPEGSAVVVERDSGRVELRAKADTTAIRAVAVAPGGDVVAAFAGHGPLFVWRGASLDFEQVVAFEQHDGLAFTGPHRLAVHRRDAYALIDVDPGAAPAIVARRSVAGATRFTRLLAVGDQLALAEPTARLWLVDASGAERSVSLSDPATALAAASRDGPLLVADAAGRVHVVDLEQAAVVDRIDVAPSPVRALAVVVRGTPGAPNAPHAIGTIVAAGVTGGVHLARLGEQTPFLHLHVPDEVRGLLALADDRLAWAGPESHGELGLPRFDARAPTMDELAALFGRTIERGALVERPALLRVVPPVDAAAR